MTEYVNIPEDKKKIVDGFNFLGLGNIPSLITSIEFSEWGETVLINCIYNPIERLLYRIVFSNCYEIKWFMNDSDLANDIEVDIFDFQIKKEQEKEYAYFHTDIFDLIIYYRTIKIEKDW